MTMPAVSDRCNRLINGIEYLAAWFLMAVTALTFIAVILRYFFAWSIPDTNDISRLLLASLIFWGMAGIGYRGEHIVVDLLWGALGPSMRRALDIFSSAVTLACMAIFTWMMGVKVLNTREENLQTFDLNQPVWIWYLMAWFGLLAAALLLAIRLWRLVSNPQLLPQQHAATAE